MDLHPGEEIVFEGRPVWRSILSFYLIGLVGAIVVGVIVGIAASTALGIVAWLVLFALVLLVGFIRRVETRYTITNQRLRIQRGILSKSVQQTRIERVQNVNTHQTVFDRMLRVGKVDFDTAGTDERGLFERLCLEDSSRASPGSRSCASARRSARRSPASSPMRSPAST